MENTANITVNEAKEISPEKTAKIWSVLFMIAAIIAAIVGCGYLYRDAHVIDSRFARIVTNSGDTADGFNYLIGAVRGVGWLCFGILCAVLSHTFNTRSRKE
jgi:hypothetical protein